MKPASPDLFEGLDDIPWPQLLHAYGSAADVPQILRDCASSDSEVADEAVSELFGNIWHQGTVYEATSFAVPFLVRLVRRPETHQRFLLLSLLEVIANGSCYPGHKDPELIAAGKRNVALASDAVERHLNDFIALAEDGDAEVRRQVPGVLARIGNGRAWLLTNAIERAVAEEDSCAAAHWLLALTFANPDAGTAEELKRAALPDVPAVALAAATLTLFCGGPSAWDAAARIVSEPFRDETPFTDLYANGFLGLSGREEHTASMLERLALGPRQIMISHLCACLPQLDDISSSMVADTCLALIFDPKALPSSAAELTDDQRTVLTQLDRAKNVHHAGDDLVILHTLQNHGVLAELGIASRTHW